MKTLISLFALMIVMTSMSFAQFDKSMAVDAAFELNFPMSSLSNGASTGWATTVRYEINVGQNWVLMLTTGYGAFGESNKTTYSYVPLVLGTKLYLYKGWYGMVETGYHFYTVDVTGGSSSSKSEWGFGIGTGWEIPLSNLLSLDLATKYQYNVDDLSYWHSRAGLMFKF